MENKISKYVTGFRKSHGTQHSLVAMLKKLKNPEILWISQRP